MCILFLLPSSSVLAFKPPAVGLLLYQGKALPLTLLQKLLKEKVCQHYFLGHRIFFLRCGVFWLMCCITAQFEKGFIHYL